MRQTTYDNHLWLISNGSVYWPYDNQSTLTYKTVSVGISQISHTYKILLMSRTIYEKDVINIKWLKYTDPSKTIIKQLDCFSLHIENISTDNETNHI